MYVCQPSTLTVFCKTRTESLLLFSKAFTTWTKMAYCHTIELAIVTRLSNGTTNRTNSSVWAKTLDYMERIPHIRNNLKRTTERYFIVFINITIFEWISVNQLIKCNRKRWFQDFGTFIDLHRPPKWTDAMNNLLHTISRHRVFGAASIDGTCSLSVNCAIYENANE